MQRRVIGPAWTLALVAMARGAWAQQEPSTVPTSSAPSAPASPAPDALPSPELAETARRLFREGAQLATQGRWEEARDRFRRALALHASPLLRFNLAIAAQNSGHFVEALDQYQHFLRDDSDPANALRRTEAQTAITAIENVVAVLTVSTRGGDSVSGFRFDGRELPLTLVGESIPVDPGEHVVEVDGAHGTHARQVVRLGEGSQRNVSLLLDAPRTATGALASASPSPAPATIATHTPPSAPVERPASQGAIERVRRLIEERAATSDMAGHRRWDRTFTPYLFQGLGNPNGLVGAGIRWSARPWIGFEMQAGVGHPFGPGIGLAINAGSPLSYRYGLGLIVGVSTNLTQIDQGPQGSNPTPCHATSSFTPVWLSTALAQEWRVSNGFAFRVALGIRLLINSRELDDALTTHCSVIEPFSAAALAVDKPNTDRNGIPVLPFTMFDIGYSL